ncbi:MAG TPA: hypothetical protein VJ732_20655, partial [Bryobacteraceae bacterium]|nr:hypothetical protein [Bryobacteraceae bacterium]
ALAPNDPLVWRSVAESRMSRHEYAGAVQAYQTALVMEPNDVSLLNSLGYAAGYAGDLSAASRALQQYQSLRPGDANPIDSMGDVNLLLGRLREAENLYLQTAKKDPNFLGGGEYSKAATARLMSGDPAGAGELYQHFLQARAKDPLLDSYNAQWDWLAGRRKEGLGQLQAFAQRLAGAPATREAASRAYSELAVWNVALGDRKTAQQMAEQAVRLAGPSTAALAAIARFIAQPAASAAEWAARADGAFPQPAQKALRDTALAYALLGCSEFEPARRILQARYDTTSPTADDELPILLAWADLETGKTREAAALLRFNPLPSAAGPKPFTVFAFPRLFFLRGRLAGMTGSPDQARAEFRTFLRLSGDQPLAWGEEQKAR